MVKRKSRFPSYGLVRGASHAQGGVAGMVAGEQPVELEGGEWIIPKEAVPDYLPVLKQITNEGRAMQQMDNGNTAMDALIASASMENGLTQPKSPMYQTGGRVYDPVSQSLVDQSYYTPEFRDSAVQSGSNIFTRPRRGDYGKLDDITAGMFDAIEAKEAKQSAYKEKHNIAAIGRDGKPIFYGPRGGIGENLLPPEERVSLPVPSDEGESGVLGKIGSFLKGINPWDKGSFTAVDDRQQGGPVDSYEGGGQLHSRRMYNQKDEERYGYQTGGQMQPRRQQEIRNPEVYGPPVPAGIDSVLKQLMMRDVNQSINPFSGDTLDFEEDSLRLLGRMKKSHMPTYGRKKMQQGGPVSGQLGEGQPLERRYGEAAGGESPGGYFPLASQAEPGALMGSIRSDRRIKPLQPDTYLQKIPLAKPFDESNLAYPSHQEEVEEVPKLSTAYLASFGMETPLSRRQGALLYRKGIAPQTLNPQVKGLINRALVQRLTNEDD